MTRPRTPERERLTTKPTTLERHLLELVAALDRRVPHAERAGEISIAKDAAKLKAKALRRIAELERDRSRQSRS